MMSAPGDVGAYYDVLTPLLEQLWGGSLHVGLWSDQEPRENPGPEPEPVTDAVTRAGDRLTDLLIRKLDPPAGRTTLDIGCGTGRPALRLARTTGARVRGITLSATQVALAETAASAAGLDDRVTFHQADAAALPFHDASFDAAWAIESLIHMPDTRRVLAETARVLTPGSPLVISDMILTGSDTHHHDHSMLRTIPQLLADLRDSAFTVTGVTRLDDHLRRSLRRLSSDLEQRREELTPRHGAHSVDALTRILGKTIPGIGPTFGYAVITTSR